MNVRTPVKLLVTLIVLSVVVYWAGVDRVAATLGRVHLGWFLAALALENAGLLLSAKKWSMLMRHHRIQMPYWHAVRYYYIGTFFNAVMPSSVGGDVVKAYESAREVPHRGGLFSSIVMDRFTGLIAVVIIVCVTLAAFAASFPAGVVFAAAGIIGIFFIGSVLLFKTDILRGFLVLVPRRRGLRDAAEETYRALKAYRFRNRRMALVMGISLFYHLMLVTVNFLLAQSLDLNVSLFYFLIFIPVTEILVFIPVTVQGFGIRESSYVLLFSSVGVSSAAAFSVGFLDQLLKIAMSVIGGGMYALSR
jgi:hypothetical protein